MNNTSNSITRHRNGGAAAPPYPRTRCFIFAMALAFTIAPSASAATNGAAPSQASSNAPAQPPRNIPHMVEADGRLRLRFGEERMVLPRGLQPSLLCMKSGALVVQAQVPEKTAPTSRMVYFNAM